MKTTVQDLDYSAVMALPKPPHKQPRRPGILFRTLVRIASGIGLMGCHFRYTKEGMKKIHEPSLILMNHSCFLDLGIVSKLFYPHPYAIVCTCDGFVGMHGWMERFMRWIGCIPTRKFVTDLQLVADIEYCLKKLHMNVLMYPEASYSFDGTATPLPQKMGVLLKKIGAPVVMIETRGAFSRNPLYNELRVRKSVPVSAVCRCLFSKQDIQEKRPEELTRELENAFCFDQFRWQKEQGIAIQDPTRAEGLNRILFRCAACGKEGAMSSKGDRLTCGNCGKVWTLTPLGELESEGGAIFPHIPDWYAWERAQIRQELLDGTYQLDIPVTIRMFRDYHAIYTVGHGRLTHDENGFHLTGCNGQLDYVQKPQACYGLYADYYWYELGDMICIGNQEALYYCFPESRGDVVAKTRLAAEELYKLWKARPRKRNLSAQLGQS